MVKCYILDVLGSEYCYSPTITADQRLQYIENCALCIVMFPTAITTSVDYSNLQQLATTAGVVLQDVKLISAHTIPLLDNVMSQLDDSQWIIVTNMQLLADPEIALSKLLKVELICTRSY